MPSSPEVIAAKIDALKVALVQQGRRVEVMAELSFEACFARDTAKAQQAIAADAEIDRIDVELEKAAVDLLTLACTDGAMMSPHQVRSVLTIVKINNELERIADVATVIAEQVRHLQPAEHFPQTFRVLANSAIGILRDSVSSLDAADPKLAKKALMSQTTVNQFKQALIRDLHQQLQSGKLTNLPLASALHDVANSAVTMTDHCTNICEQVLYVATGTIMRHMEGRWEEVNV